MVYVGRATAVRGAYDTGEYNKRVGAAIVLSLLSPVFIPLLLKR